MGEFFLFTTAELRSRGETIASIRRSIDVGERYRVMKGWYATPGTPADAALAMRMGGRLGCVSALALRGAWAPFGSRPARAVPHGCIWTAEPNLLIAVLDSLLHRGLISRNRLVAIVLQGPKRVHHLVSHLEPRSESGIESILRYLLAMAGISTDVQVTMRSADRLDLEVGGWLALEADGRETHAREEAFTRDRARVVRLMRQGRIVLQFSCAAIMYDFDTVLEAVRDVMARHAPVT